MFQVEKCGIVILQRAECEPMNFLGNGSEDPFPARNYKCPFGDRGGKYSLVLLQKETIPKESGIVFDHGEWLTCILDHAQI